VNDSGDVEWAVLTGPDRREAVIETDEERREARKQAVARAAAEARVDWTRVGDVHRLPTLAYDDAEGCYHTFVLGGPPIAWR
jgi:hypothetical protein